MCATSPPSFLCSLRYSLYRDALAIGDSLSFFSSSLSMPVKLSKTVMVAPDVEELDIHHAKQRDSLNIAPDLPCSSTAKHPSSNLTLVHRIAGCFVVYRGVEDGQDAGGEYENPDTLQHKARSANG